MPIMTAENFATLFNTTRPSLLTPVDKIINLARQTNYIWFKLISGQNPFNVAQGGVSIVDVMKTSDTGTFAPYNPSDLANVRIAQTTSPITFPWRFNRSHVAWNETLLALNTAGGAVARIKAYKKTLKLDQNSEHAKGLDSQLFARPDYLLMEAPSAQGQTPTPYSLLAWIREDTVRFLPPAAVWGTASLAGNNPQLATWMRNKVANYTVGNLADPFFGIIAAMDNMSIQVGYSALPGTEDMEAIGPEQLDIFTNKDGYTTYQTLCRMAQASWRNPNDPKQGNKLYYNGIEISHTVRLDIELLEQTIGTNAAYAGTPYVVGKPRYLWVNKRHTRPVINEGNAMSEMKAYFLPDRPDTWVSWMTTTYNTVSNAPNWNGIVAPAQVAV